MKACPECGEKKFKWSNANWDANEKDFWTQEYTVLFNCGGKYKFTSSGYETLIKCGRTK